MKYMGSKRRIAKHIIPIMVEYADNHGITDWVEPFVGGANLIDKVPNRFNRIGYDLNEHVIYALKDIRDRYDELPESISEEYYKSTFDKIPESITSLARFGASFGGKFQGGFARGKKKNGENRNYWSETVRNAQKQSPLIQGVDFIHANYLNLTFKNSLIYCDPPYQNTSGYKTGDFNHEEFFDWCREQKSRGNIVFVSEYYSPFTEVWRGGIKTNFSSTRKKATHHAVERLFIV